MIMIITPDETFRRGCTEYLQERGYELSIPEHRQDVIRLVQEQAPEVIVLNLSISEPNGPNLLKSIRDHGYAGKIIVMSEPSNRPVIGDVHHHHVDQVMMLSPTAPVPFVMTQLECLIRSSFRGQISRRAYEYWLERSGQHGYDWEDWFTAEKEIMKTHTPHRRPHPEQWHHTLNPD
ncbi:MAG: response regulator [Nitrospirota bacterium]